MSKWIKQYLMLVSVVLFLFATFVACGSQLYQVSLKDDFNEEKAPESSRDASSPSYGIHSPGGWTDLPIRFRFGSSLSTEQRAAIEKAMDSWEMAVGRELFRNTGVHSGVDGDSFKDLYSSLSDKIDGQYLDQSWDKTGKPSVVLATTIWDNLASDFEQIATADIRYNGEYYILGDSLILQATESREVVDLESLALHELGHLLGLAHCDSSVDAYSIMNPYLFIGEKLTSRKISKGDIERIQSIYGCEDDSCDIDDLVAKIEKIGVKGDNSNPTETH